MKQYYVGDNSGPHMNGESDACSLFDMHHPSIGDRLKALPAVVVRLSLSSCNTFSLIHCVNYIAV
jgi:hypothetical protein